MAWASTAGHTETCTEVLGRRIDGAVEGDTSGQSSGLPSRAPSKTIGEWDVEALYFPIILGMSGGGEGGRDFARVRDGWTRAISRTLRAFCSDCSWKGRGELCLWMV